MSSYAQQFDLTQTRTWQLCGAFAIAEPGPVFCGWADSGLPAAERTNGWWSTLRQAQDGADELRRSGLADGGRHAQECADGSDSRDSGQLA